MDAPTHVDSQCGILDALEHLLRDASSTEVPKTSICITISLLLARVEGFLNDKPSYGRLIPYSFSHATSGTQKRKRGPEPTECKPREPKVPRHSRDLVAAKDLTNSHSSRIVASHPVANHPTANHPTASRPTANHPAANHTAASHPAASHPTASHPAASHPAASHPAASHPAASHPAANHTAANRTAANRTAASHTVASHTVANRPASNNGALNYSIAAIHPAASHPAASHPAASHPAASHPAASHPAGSHPAASHPVTISTNTQLANVLDSGDIICDPKNNSSIKDTYFLANALASAAFEEAQEILDMIKNERMFWPLPEMNMDLTDRQQAFFSNPGFHCIYRCAMHTANSLRDGIRQAFTCVLLYKLSCRSYSISTLITAFCGAQFAYSGDRRGLKKRLNGCFALGEKYCSIAAGSGGFGVVCLLPVIDITTWKHLPIAAVVAELQKSKIHQASKPYHDLAQTFWQHGLSATYAVTKPLSCASSERLFDILHILAQPAHIVEYSLLAYASAKRKRWAPSGDLEDFSIKELGADPLTIELLCDKKKLDDELRVLESKRLIHQQDGKIHICDGFAKGWKEWKQALPLVCFYLTGCEYADRFSAIGNSALPVFQEMMQEFTQQHEDERRPFRRVILPALVQASKFSGLHWKRRCIDILMF
ncbi:hypothetical protein HBI68_255320 [Parastagonospora nodorum]|nr:hypothetical protein HBI68_255320 [Parastagonospora nodorum]KAH6383057.1 hypothetical protein HBI60_258990 [Parastagonospora nodorum]